MGKMILTLTLLAVTIVGQEGIFPPPVILDEELLFAHFGNGQGLVSEIVLYSTDNARETQALILIDGADGNPMAIDLNGRSVGGQMDVSIPASGARRFRTSGLGPIVRGSVRVLSDRPLAGVVLFGGDFGLAGVSSSAPLETGFQTPVDEDAAAAVGTGIAVRNLEDHPIDLDLQLYDSDGVLFDSAQASLAGDGQMARFLCEFEWSSGADHSRFEGTLKVFGSGRIAATALRTRPGQLASLPVTPLSGSAQAQPKAVCSGSWSGTYDDAHSSRITFRVVEQSTISSVRVDYIACDGRPAVATAAAGTIRADRSFSIALTGSNVLGNVRGRFAADGKSIEPGSFDGLPSGVFILKQCGGGNFSWRARPEIACE